MSARLYSPVLYYISKALVQLPFQLMNVVVFVHIVYYMTGLRTEGDALMKHLIILTLAFLIFSQVPRPHHPFSVCVPLDLELCSDCGTV